MGKYTLKDLKNGLVILENDSDKITKKILKKVWKVKFNDTNEFVEYPAYTYYFKCEKNPSYNWGCCDNSNKGFLNSYGKYETPKYLIGFKSEFHYLGIDQLPIQKASKFLK